MERGIGNALRNAQKNTSRRAPGNPLGNDSGNPSENTSRNASGKDMGNASGIALWNMYFREQHGKLPGKHFTGVDL